MSRKLPYKSEPKKWEAILNRQIEIPINQREYSWGKSETDEFVDDIINIFEEDTYGMKMGSVISLKEEGKKTEYIYDGQQRILTTTVLLQVIGIITDNSELKYKIKSLLTVNNSFDILTEKQLELKEKNGYEIIPRIYCINKADRIALTEIFNNEVDVYINYLNDYECLREREDEDHKFKCCHEDCTLENNKYIYETSRKNDFVRHLINKHNFSDKSKNSSKLYNAYINIYISIKLRNFKDIDLINLFSFITKEIEIQYYECSDSNYVSKIFDWENNRGKDVQKLDIMKNQVIVNVPDEYKLEVYERWEGLKNRENKVYSKNFGQKIFDIAIQIYNGKIERKPLFGELYKKIIYNDDIMKSLGEFFSLIENLMSIIDQVSKDKFGNLLLETPGICLTWEGFCWFILPIFHKIQKIDTEVIHLFTKWYFRNMCIKHLTFNNMIYSTKFIEISNKVLKDPSYNYFSDVLQCLKDNVSEEIKTEEKYIQRMKEFSFKGTTKAIFMLYFLETSKTTDINLVSFKGTLEHVIAKKNITMNEMTNNLGNLTLLEGKNSKNGIKGNSSLGAKAYEDKKETYLKSCYEITKEIPANFSDFTELKIIERCVCMSKKIYEHSQYF